MHGNSDFEVLFKQCDRCVNSVAMAVATQGHVFLLWLNQRDMSSKLSKQMRIIFISKFAC